MFETPEVSGAHVPPRPLDRRRFKTPRGLPQSAAARLVSASARELETAALAQSRRRPLALVVGWCRRNLFDGLTGDLIAHAVRCDVSLRHHSHQLLVLHHR